MRERECLLDLLLARRGPRAAPEPSIADPRVARVFEIPLEPGHGTLADVAREANHRDRRTPAMRMGWWPWVTGGEQLIDRHDARRTIRLELIVQAGGADTLIERGHPALVSHPGAAVIHHSGIRHGAVCLRDRDALSPRFVVEHALTQGARYRLGAVPAGESFAEYTADRVKLIGGNLLDRDVALIEQALKATRFEQGFRRADISGTPALPVDVIEIGLTGVQARQSGLYERTGALLTDQSALNMCLAYGRPDDVDQPSRELGLFAGEPLTHVRHGIARAVGLRPFREAPDQIPDAQVWQSLEQQRRNRGGNRRIE